MAACVAERLTPLEVRGSSPARRVVSLDKELYSTLSLFTQVYKWVPATYCWGGGGGGGDPAMGYLPAQWGVAMLLGMPHAKVARISSGRLGLWLVCAFTLPYLTT